MEQVRYMISDAANIVAVESHVLRYWEDELELTVPRNELGHRYYTQENVDQFLRIRQLKEEGYQLKAIKIILKDEKQGGVHNELTDYASRVTKDGRLRTEAEQTAAVGDAKKQTQLQTAQKQAELTPQERMEQFQELMTQIVRNAMTENNQELSGEIGTQVGDRVLKEMNYLMRMQDEQEEERYRKLDEAIRSFGKRQKKVIRRKRADKHRLKTATGMEG